MYGADTSSHSGAYSPDPKSCCAEDAPGLGTYESMLMSSWDQLGTNVSMQSSRAAQAFLNIGLNNYVDYFGGSLF